MKPFEPMKAASKIPAIEDLKYPLYASIKLDGIRCAVIDGVTYTRNCKRIPNLYVQKRMLEIGSNRLDGELYLAKDHDFNKCQSAFMSVHGEPDFEFHVFDYIPLDNPVSLRMTFSERLDNLHQAKGSFPDFVKVLKQNLCTEPGQVAALYDNWLHEGFEGAVCRSPNGLYKYGRSTINEGYAVKLKPFTDSEAIIVTCNELMRNTNTATKELHNMVGGDTLGSFTVLWQGKYFEIGSGLDNEMRDRYWSNQAHMIDATITFKYQGVGPNGKPRFPVIKGVRHD